MSKRMSAERLKELDELIDAIEGEYDGVLGDMVQGSRELLAEATRARASELEWKAEAEYFMEQLRQAASRAAHQGLHEIAGRWEERCKAAEAREAEWKAKAEDHKLDAERARIHQQQAYGEFAGKLKAAEARAAELEVEAESHLVTVKELAEARAMGGAETNRAHRIRLQYEELYSEALKLKAEIAVLRKAAAHPAPGRARPGARRLPRETAK